MQHNFACARWRGDFQISLKEELPEQIQSGYTNFGKEVVVLTKFNKLTLEGKIPGNYL